jgi:organic hydroperoxide reductase OsmC/OhrA
MTVLKREATIRWLDHPPGGTPRLTVGSEALTPSLPLNVDRDAAHPLAASPGELLAGAIGATFAWLTAQKLMSQGTQARELTASVTLTMSDEAGDGADLALSAVACHVSARVPSIDQDQLEIVAGAAMARCIKALGMHAERIEVTVEVLLESA